jgi:D-glycero-D-manno-heptose 1,7-bisphosphate phosphatase
MSFSIAAIQSDWTLFLDRDGVINIEKNEDYIRKWEEFQFYPNSLTALSLLATKFNTIVITTNQKGVGKGLMSETDLQDIHYNMKLEVNNTGGKIDEIYYCTDLDNLSVNRKPQAGMALQAQKQFPTIDFKKSIMVGNRLSDMQFGRNAGMYTCFVSTTHPDTPFPHIDIDIRFKDLYSFAQAL